MDAKTYNKVKKHRDNSIALSVISLLGLLISQFEINSLHLVALFVILDILFFILAVTMPFVASHYWLKLKGRSNWWLLLTFVSGWISWIVFASFKDNNKPQDTGKLVYHRDIGI